VRAEDMANPAARARLYRGVRGQLARGLIALTCAIVAVGVGIFYPFTHSGARIVPLICGGIVGILTLLGLLLYGASSVERSAVLPATVVILGYKQLPLRSGNGQPYVRLVLDVYPEGGSRYESTVQTIVPELAVPHLRVGAQFRAQVAGPEKPSAVLVDFSTAIEAGAAPVRSATARELAGVAGPDMTEPAESGSGRARAAAGTGAPAEPRISNADPADRLRELEELKTQGLVTDAEYRAQRSRILDSL